jgi:hypothetical protein
MKEETVPGCADGSVTVLKHNGVETIHNLWSTPIVIAKPFDDAFMTQLKKDVELVLPRAQKNSVDVWQLPNLPETMLMVRDKELEIANRVFKADAEMPLPDLKISKGYFRHIHPDSAYRITPHHHGSTLGAGVFYIKLNNDNPGNMIFMDPRGGVNYNNQFSPFKRIRLEEGMMIITPGYLVHFVEPTDYDKPVYQERLLLVSNIHRMYEDWIKKLDENETQIKSMGSKEL